MKDRIKEALASLDPADDEAWTKDGLPRIDVVERMVGQRGINRAAITEADPTFTREAAASRKEAADGDGTSGPGPDEAQAQAVEPSAEQPQEAAEAAQEQPEAPAEEEVPPAAPAGNVDDLKEERDALGEAMNEAYREAEQARAKADDLANKVNALNRRIEVMERRDPNHGTKAIRDYIDQSNRQRAARADRLRQFVGANDASPKEVADALEMRSPLDRAMMGRKPARGSKRPQMRLRPQ